MEFETLILKKVYNPEKGDFGLQLFLVKAQFIAETYMKVNSCPKCGMDVKRHEFSCRNGLILEVCKPQNVTYGAIATFEYGEPQRWVKVLSETKMTKGEAIAYIRKNKIVQTPNITLFLLR
jgi:hypothetical protein